jgi:bifunctional non-homologous end joining protein LigD
MFNFFRRKLKQIAPSTCNARLPKHIDSSYIAEEKIDGVRFLMYLGGDNTTKNGMPNSLLSRNRTNKTYIDKAANVPHITANDYGLDKTVLDGELLLNDFDTTNSLIGMKPDKAIAQDKATYYVFDILFYKGKDLRNLPLYDRQQILFDLVDQLGNEHIKCVRTYYNNFKYEFTRIVKNGGEGLIIKDLEAPYGKGWAKYKKVYDVSAFITGFKYGNGKNKDLVCSLELSVYHNRRLKRIGFVNVANHKLRHEITANQKRYKKQIVDLFAMEMTKNGILRQPSLHRFRNDVNVKSITLDKLKRDIETNLRHNREKSNDYRP